MFLGSNHSSIARTQTLVSVHSHSASHSNHSHNWIITSSTIPSSRQFGWVLEPQEYGSPHLQLLVLDAQKSHHSASCPGYNEGTCDTMKLFPKPALHEQGYVRAVQHAANRAHMIFLLVKQSCYIPVLACPLIKYPQKPRLVPQHSQHSIYSAPRVAYSLMLAFHISVKAVKLRESSALNERRCSVSSTRLLPQPELFTFTLPSHRLFRRPLITVSTGFLAIGMEADLILHLVSGKTF